MGCQKFFRMPNQKAKFINHNVDFSDFFDKRQIVFRKSAGSDSLNGFKDQ